MRCVASARASRGMAARVGSGLGTILIIAPDHGFIGHLVVDGIFGVEAGDAVGIALVEGLDPGFDEVSWFHDQLPFSLAGMALVTASASTPPMISMAK